MAPSSFLLTLERAFLTGFTELHPHRNYMTLSPGCGTPCLTVSIYSGSTLEKLVRAREFTQGSWELWTLILSLIGVPSTARSDSRAQQGMPQTKMKSMRVRGVGYHGFLTQPCSSPTFKPLSTRSSVTAPTDFPSAVCQVPFLHFPLGPYRLLLSDKSHTLIHM